MKKKYIITGITLVITNIIIAFANVKYPSQHLAVCNELLGTLIMLCFSLYFLSSGWRIAGWVFFIASVILCGMSIHYIWRIVLA